MLESGIYRTRHLYEASALYSLDVPFLKIEESDRVCWFLFQRSEHCEAVVSRFWSRQLTGDLKAYADAIKTMKDLIFGKERQQDAPMRSPQRGSRGGGRLGRASDA